MQLAIGRQLSRRHSKNRGQSMVVSQAQVCGSSARHSPASINRHRLVTLSHVAVDAQSAFVLQALVSASTPEEGGMDCMSFAEAFDEVNAKNAHKTMIEERSMTLKPLVSGAADRTGTCCYLLNSRIIRRLTDAA